MVKIFPPGYDPIIAHGPPTNLYDMLKGKWTPDDTQRHRELEKHAVLQDTVPIGRWYAPHNVADEIQLSEEDLVPITERGM
jgi:hypothetical protein